MSTDTKVGDSIQRDQWGRPLIKDPVTGKLTGYTRISTAAKTHEDPFRIYQSKLNKVIAAIGKMENADLFAKATLLDLQDPAFYRTAVAIGGELYDRIGGNIPAEMGTALHHLSEFVDNGVNLPVESIGIFVDDLVAYKQTIEAEGFKVRMMEEFIVVDELQVAGSFDRIWDTPHDGVVVSDLKTGATAPRYALATEMQVAMYSRGQLYNPETGERTPLPEELRQDLGFLIHLPALEGKCTIHELDLNRGWREAIRAYETRQWRKEKSALPYRPLVPQS